MLDEEDLIEEIQENPSDLEEDQGTTSSNDLTCEVCWKSFKSLRGLYHHFTKYRNIEDPAHPPLKICQTCNGRYFTKKSFKTHKCVLKWRTTKHLPIPAGQNTARIPEIPKDPKNLHCEMPGCRYNSPVERHFLVHLRNHRKKKDPPLMTCGTCQRVFYSSVVYSQHRCESVSPICHYCQPEKRLASRVDVYKHMKQSHRTTNKLGELIFQCNYPECQQTSKSPMVMFYHLAGHYQPLSLVCTICSKLENNYLSFNIHMGYHREQKTSLKKQFICDFCNSRLASKKSLSRHIKARHLLSRYQCQQCENHYSTKGILMKHKMNAHGLVAQFECSFCAAKFLYASEFKAHQKRHLENDGNESSGRYSSRLLRDGSK